ncbi:MAG: hypothetical protein ACRD3C_01020 [Vicinamibacterales bacterium]
MITDLRGDAKHALQLIPGAYDRTTLTHRQPGSMGGPSFGSGNVAIGSSSMDAATIADREMEGGGGLSQRRRKVDAQPQAGRALTGAERTAAAYAMWVSGHDESASR